VGARGVSGVFYDTRAHALAVRVDHAGFFLMDTIKALVQDTKYEPVGYGVFPNLASVTYMSIRITTVGRCALDTIRPIARLLRKEPPG
jgi:hypothetical protein